MYNNTIKKIINQANISSEVKRRYKILTFPTHERYETQLCKTGHEFYAFSHQRMKQWNVDQTDIPENYHILPEQDLCSYLDYDFILAQSKFGQIQAASQMKQLLNIPLICLEHTIPTPQTMSRKSIEDMKNMLGDVNVFISEYSMKEWDIAGAVIYHGIDTQTFKQISDIEKGNYILTVANDFMNRDYCLNYSGWQRVTKDLNTKLLGDTPGLSKSASCISELVEEYNKCSVYFNSTTLSPIPMSLLEAMSCGCAVVSTATCMIPEIIKNGYNGFISNNEQELRSYIEKIMSDNNLRSELGNNARKTIMEMFSEEKFIDQWNILFDKIYEVSNS